MDGGWEWRGALHERLERKPGAGPRVHSQWVREGKTPWILHAPADSGPARSTERNAVIARKMYEEAQPSEKGLAAYYLAQHARVRGGTDEAERLYLEAIEGCDGTNIAAMAASELTQLLLPQGRLAAARSAIVLAIGNCPESPEGYGILGLVYQSGGQIERAALMYDQFFRIPRGEVGVSYLYTVDESMVSGVIPAHAAMAYAQLGRVEEALRLFHGIPQALRADPRVEAAWREAQRVVMQSYGLDVVRKMFDFFIWSTEPIKLLAFLQILPASISELPQIATLRRQLSAKLPHLSGWEGYKKAYASIPADVYHTNPAHVSGVRNLGRARKVIEWAKSLDQQGPLVYVCSIGSQDCHIEEAVMECNPRIRMGVCDVGPRSSEGMQRLMQRFPGRVVRHEIVEHEYDWPDCTRTPAGEFVKFDAIFLFEVIEHVPEVSVAFDKLASMLSPTGKLFLSTPNSPWWIEQYLTDPRQAPPFYGHVRGYNAPRLMGDARMVGLDGTIETTEGGALFFATFGHDEGAHLRRFESQKQRVSILVPGTPTPFDPRTLAEGFLGGSEEAVVHLAKSLSDEGHVVTVYAPMPEREFTIEYYDSVRWRPASEFDPAGDHGTVLFWRCPQTAQEPWFASTPYRKLLWLHDCAYGASADAYAAFDRVLVLSKSHRQSIVKYDLQQEDARVRFEWVQNGIDVREFPELTDAIEDARVSGRVIYCSSPDRGLEHLLRIWPKVREQIPNAELHIYYDWSGFKARLPELARKLAAMLKILNAEGWEHAAAGLDEGPGPSVPPEVRAAWVAALRQASDALRIRYDFPENLRVSPDGSPLPTKYGVRFFGGVSQPELHEAMRHASVWAYPNSGDVETFCITAVKAQAAGCWPVATSAGALPEVIWDAYPDPTLRKISLLNPPDWEGWIDPLFGASLTEQERFDRAFLDRVVGALWCPNDAHFRSLRREMRQWALAQFSWETTASMFRRVITKEG